MRRVYAAEIKASWLTWLGVCLTFIAANYGLAVGFLYIATGIQGYANGVMSEMNLTQFAFLGAINIFFGSIVGAAVIGASTALVIASRRGAFARLALAGATPGQVVKVVMTQLVVVTIACAVVGDLLAAITFPIYVMAEASDREMAVPSVSQAPLAYLGANALCILIALIGGWKQARAASRIPPVEALRPVRETTAAVRRRSWILRGLVIAGCLFIIAFAGSVGGLIMMSRQRDAELALASIVGATPSQRVLMSLFEALLITVTGVLAGLLMAAMSVGFMTYAINLVLGVAVLAIPVGLLLAVVGVCLVIAIAATVLPILPALNKPAPAVIARLVSE